MKYGFVYIWYDRKHKRYYVGSHWGRETDGYICSSRWMRKAYKRRPQDFKRRILCFCSSKRLMLEEEQRWLSMIKINKCGKRYYNISMSVKNPWWNDKTQTKTVGQKISQAHKANPNWGAWARGKIVSEETREKLRQINLGNKHSDETKAKCRAYRHTPEAREKIRQAGLGRIKSKETREKLRQAHKGKFYHTLNENAKKTISEIHKGTKWINNGLINKRYKGNELPEGFSYGRF